MLYERWQQVAGQHSNHVAITDSASGRSWTFSELADAGSSLELPEAEVHCPTGHDVQFLAEVIAAWRLNRPVLPLERGQSPPVLAALPSEIAHLKLTSGTTGQPHTVLFTAEQLAADADHIVSTMGLARSLPNLGVISLAHSYGFSNLVTPLLLHGIPLVLCPTPLPEMVRKAASGRDAITLPAVPAMWRAWHEAGAIPDNVRIAISAGAPLPLELENAVFARSGLKIHNFCGSSECGGIAYDQSEEPRTDARLIGQPLDNVSLSINADGCLVVESAAVGEGYLSPTDSRLGQGRFVTSDLAELDDGVLRIVGRASDVINVAGRKLSPEIVETVLRRQNGVADCVVFGTTSRDAARVEEVVAAVVLKSGSTVEEIERRVGHELEGWQRPRHWWLVESITTSARGKISRNEWRERFARRTAENGSPSNSRRID